MLTVQHIAPTVRATTLDTAALTPLLFTVCAFGPIIYHAGLCKLWLTSIFIQEATDQHAGVLTKYGNASVASHDLYFVGHRRPLGSHRTRDLSRYTQNYILSVAVLQ